jgi:glycosyltransferase involved in cell wall biosynthesis
MNNFHSSHSKFSNSAGRDLICFSHLRWDFVYQRPQHLMSRFAQYFRVFFFEEPVFHNLDDDLSIRLSDEKIWVIRPMLKENSNTGMSVIARQKMLLNRLFNEKKIEQFITWYYTPMALKFSSHLKPQAVVYDCMDELSAFKFAPVELKLLEAELFKKADVVFTGGHSLYQAKKNAHTNIFPFPSSIDKEHFRKARTIKTEPADQQSITGVRFGFYGVIDERFDIKLIKEVAEKKPDWQFVLIGPVVKIDEADLPRAANIHYLGGKSYKELPQYLAGWDIAMIPFAKNESTKFISPTKTPEYLAGGKPVISSSITDVVHPYFDHGLVYIADTPEQFIAAAEKELSKDVSEKNNWLKRVDDFIANDCWDNTTGKMLSHIDTCLLSSTNLPATGNLKSVA